MSLLSTKYSSKDLARLLRLLSNNKSISQSTIASQRAVIIFKDLKQHALKFPSNNMYYLDLYLSQLKLSLNSDLTHKTLGVVKKGDIQLMRWVIANI